MGCSEEAEDFIANPWASFDRLILHDGSLRTRPKAEMNPSAQPLHVSCSAEMQVSESYMPPSDSTRGSVHGQSQSNDKHDDLPCVEPT